LPYLIIARKEIRTVQDLKGKTMGVGTSVGLPYQLLKAFVKKFSLEDMQIRFLGGSQSTAEKLFAEAKGRNS
jgi:ABC-type nitrate/sulfonate/bicarbonate transport system substrate-binding protein